jgi:hypothetical protein
LVGELTLDLLLLGSSGLGGTAGSSSTASGRGSGGSASGTDVQQEVLDILALEGLGEEREPDGLDVGDLGSGDDGGELVGLFGGSVSVLSSLSLSLSPRESSALLAVLDNGRMSSLGYVFIDIWIWTYGDLQTVIREDEGGVGSGELGGGHFELMLDREKSKGEIGWNMEMPSTFCCREGLLLAAEI